MKLNNMLNQYVRNRGGGGKQGVRNSVRQSEVPNVQCVEDFSASCATNRNKDEYMINMFESYKFRINQVENNNQKYLRIGNFAKVMANKGGKKDDFQNTTAWLVAVVGGDINNPKCRGQTSGAETEAIQNLYNSISKCNETIATSCVLNNTVLERDESVFETCNTVNTALKDKIDECREIPAEQEEGRCQCFELSMMMIDDIKNTKYTINTPDGPQERNCVVALAKSSPLVKTGYDSCVNALRECKKDEDTSIGIINACNSATAGSRMIVSHFRSFMANEEDEDEDEELDYDYDY